MKLKFIIGGILPILLLACTKPSDQEFENIKNVYNSSNKVDSLEGEVINYLVILHDAGGEIPESYKKLYWSYIHALNEYFVASKLASKIILKNQINVLKNDSYKNLLNQAEAFIKSADFKHEQTLKVIILYEKYIKSPPDLVERSILLGNNDGLKVVEYYYNSSKQEFLTAIQLLE